MQYKSLTPTSLLPDIDIEHCPNCSGALKIIAAIEDPPAIVRILIHLGLPSRESAPPSWVAQDKFLIWQDKMS